MAGYHHYGTSTPVTFTRSVDDILRSAENALGVRGSSRIDPTPPRFVDPVPSTERVAKHFDGTSRRSEGALLAAAPNSFDDEPIHMNSVEMSRQLRVCMREIRDLRTELQTERDNRNQLAMMQIKRMKEELRVEQKQSEHALLHAMREIEGTISQKMGNIDNLYSMERKRIEDVLRIAKVNDRSNFDTAEQLREAIEDVKVTSDRAVAAAEAIRTEAIRMIERENSRMASRIDEQMNRFLEMHRQQQASMNEVKNAVASEVATASKQIDLLVDKAWSTQSSTMNRRVEERLTAFESLLRRNDSEASTLNSQVQKHMRDTKQEVANVTADLQNRVLALESAMPLLVGRIDRTERKGDAVVESANKLTAHVEVLRDAADRAQVQGQRAVERAQKLDDAMADRDQRITVLESQLSVVASVERWRQELEVIRRGLHRVETQVDAVRTIADRDEKAVAAMQAQAEEVAEKSHEQEKRSQKANTRLEAAEAKLNAFVDRMGQIENETGVLGARTGTAAAIAESAAQRVAALEGKLKGVTEKAEIMHRDASARAAVTENRVESCAEGLSQNTSQIATLRKDIERVDKKATKIESSAFNASDNIKDARDQLDATASELTVLKRRIEAVAAKSGGTSASAVAQQALTNQQRDEATSSAISLLQANIEGLRLSTEATANKIVHVEERLKVSISQYHQSTEDDITRVRDDIRDLSRRADKALMEAQSATAAVESSQRQQAQLVVDIQQLAKRHVTSGDATTILPSVSIDSSVFATKVELSTTATQLRTEINLSSERLKNEMSKISAITSNNHFVAPLAPSSLVSPMTVLGTSTHLSHTSPAATFTPQPILSVTQHDTAVSPAVSEHSPLHQSKTLSQTTTPLAAGKPPIMPAAVVNASTPSPSRTFGNNLLTPTHHMPTTWSEVKKTPYSESEGEFDSPPNRLGKGQLTSGAGAAVQKVNSVTSELTQSGSFHLASSPREEVNRFGAANVHDEDKSATGMESSSVPPQPVVKPSAFSNFDSTTEDDMPKKNPTPNVTQRPAALPVVSVPDVQSAEHDGEEDEEEEEAELILPASQAPASSTASKAVTLKSAVDDFDDDDEEEGEDEKKIPMNTNTLNIANVAEKVENSEDLAKENAPMSQTQPLSDRNSEPDDDDDDDEDEFVLPTDGAPTMPQTSVSPQSNSAVAAALAKPNPFTNASLNDFDDESEDEKKASFDDGNGSDGGAMIEAPPLPVAAPTAASSKPPLGTSAAAKKALAARASSSDEDSDDGLALPDNIGTSKAKHYVSESSGPEETANLFRRGASSIMPSAQSRPTTIVKSNFDDDSSEDEGPKPIATFGSRISGTTSTTRPAPVAGRRMSPTSARSRRTTDVSLSLTSTSSPQSKKKDDYDDSDEDGADDDTLARMLGTMK